MSFFFFFYVLFSSLFFIFPPIACFVGPSLCDQQQQQQQHRAARSAQPTTKNPNDYSHSSNCCLVSVFVSSERSSLSSVGDLRLLLSYFDSNCLSAALPTVYLPFGRRRRRNCRSVALEETHHAAIISTDTQHKFKDDSKSEVSFGRRGLRLSLGVMAQSSSSNRLSF